MLSAMCRFNPWPVTETDHVQHSLFAADGALSGHVHGTQFAGSGPAYDEGARLEHARHH